MPIASSESEENNFKQYLSPKVPKRRIVYVRLFASRHTKSSCERRRSVGRPSVFYRIERAHLARVNQTDRSTKRLDSSVEKVICTRNPGLRGLHSRRGKTYGLRDSAEASRSVWIEFR